MKHYVLLVGVLMCATTLFSGCREFGYSRTDVSIEWRIDPDHHGYYLPPDEHHHGDKHHRVYNEEHRVNRYDHPDRGGDNRGSSSNVPGKDDGAIAIQQYVTDHNLSVHITRIEPMTDVTKPGATAQSANIVKRYKVIDADAHTSKVVEYNPNTGALAIE